MTFGSAKGGNSHNVTTHNAIWGSQKIESFVYRWLSVSALFNATCFFAFVGASDIISSFLLVF